SRLYLAYEFYTDTEGLFGSTATSTNLVCTGRHVPWRSGMGTPLTRHPFVSIPPLALVPMIVGRYCTSCTEYSVRENRVWHSTDRGQVLVPTCPLFGVQNDPITDHVSRNAFSLSPPHPLVACHFEGAELG